MLLSCENLRKHFGAQEIFMRLNCRIEDDDRIGLVGPNGAGKTTLIRILAGLEEPTEGTLDRKSGLRVGYLPQKPPLIEGQTLWDAALDVFRDVRAMEEELHRLSEDLADPAKHDEALKKYSKLQHELEARGGYGYEQRIKRVLSGLGFPEARWHAPLVEFSGGQRTRAFLARLLLEDPELLILDEPTNHLDLDSLEWLESWLAECKHALLIVSHDRWFLDKVTTKTWEMTFGVLEAYRGHYSHYLRQREERFTDRMSQWESQQAYIERTREFIRRFIAGQRSKEAQGRRTHLEKFMEREAIPKPRKPKRVRIQLPTEKTTGDLVLQTKNLRVGYEPGKPIVEVDAREVRRGQRVGFVGPNGAGKTTLLKTLMDRLKPLTGKVRLGAGVEIGYLSQAQDELDPNETVLGTLKALKPLFPDEGARTILGAFLFGGEEVHKRVKDLSGGERSRLALARISVIGATVLMLDEPTNHLDIAAQEELQEALKSFEGTIFFVSHDRYLVQSLATQLWIIDAGKLAQIDGGWEAYLAWRDKQQGKTTTAPPVLPAPSKKDGAQAQEPETSSAPLDNKEAARRRHQQHEQNREAQREEQKRKRQIQKALDQQKELEPRIAELEKKLAELNAAINTAGERSEREEVARLGQEFQATDTQLRDLYERWVELGAQTERSG